MRRRLLGALLVCILIPLVGFATILMACLRSVMARTERVFILGGLGVVLSMGTPLTDQLSQAMVTHEVQAAMTSMLAVFLLLMIGYGMRSPGLRRFRRVLRHRGWSF